MNVNIEDFERQVDAVQYKNEYYSVRDNGAVFRHSRPNKRLRKDDNQWTFGVTNDKGYKLISTEFVHRIVGYAFWGEPPTSQYVIDHIDTNRQNNRPENLRWLTRLENVLNNPITVKRIIFCCGSIEAFLNDPTILKNHENDDRNFSWLRTVTPEEARISFERITSWAKSDKIPSGGYLGEWIYNRSMPKQYVEEVPDFTNSLTPNAVQKVWKTPAEFPCCPQDNTSKPIATYYLNLQEGKIFSQSKYLTAIVSNFAVSHDGIALWVVCENSANNAMKPWLVAKVTHEKGLFVHSNVGSFVAKDGAEKRFILAQGLEWTRGVTFDDFI